MPVVHFASNDLDLDVGRIFDVSGAALLLLRALMTTGAFDFKDGDARNLFVGYGLSDFISFEALDDRLDFLHGSTLLE
jgi:hypothetical protein